MKDLIQNVSHIFQQKFGYEPDTFIQAPGRVNLIGEHTDYNDGFVLPCAINYQTVICCHKRNDNIINVIAADYNNEHDRFSLDTDIKEHQNYQWANYIRGVIIYIQKHTENMHGVDFVVSGNIPQGAGLSSSASLEVAVAKMMQVLYDLPLSGTQLALIGQEAENKFVGCHCGIMDQLISALGQADHALLIDCRTLVIQPVSLPKNCSVVIINSNVQRGLVDSEYNTRRVQCEMAAKTLNIKALRDADLDHLNRFKNQLEPLVYKRAHHVITENLRTIEASKALVNGDLRQLSSLMAQSHASMRDDFAITIPAIDYLVEIVANVIGYEGGVRMTGGGFGGCIVALMPHEKIDIVRHTVAEKFQQRFGLKEDFYVCHASKGASNV